MEQLKELRNVLEKLKINLEKESQREKDSMKELAELFKTAAMHEELLKNKNPAEGLIKNREENIKRALDNANR